SYRQPVDEPLVEPGVAHLPLCGADVVLDAVERDERGSSIVQDVRRPGITIAWLSDAARIEDQPLFAERDRVSVSMRREVQPTLFDIEDEVRVADDAETGRLQR